MVTVRFFAQAAGWAGGRRAELPCRSPLALEDFLADPRFASVRRPGVRFAVNHELSGPRAIVRDGDEVAVLPPVSGG